MKKKGVTKLGLTSVVGNAGEYLVMGELLRRGVIAGLTPRNAPGFDIIATDGKTTVNLRVKTKNNAKKWRWNASSGDWRANVFHGMMPKDYCVLVDLAGGGPPLFRIVPTRRLESQLKRSHKKWVETLGRHGKRHSRDNKMRTIHPGNDFLRRYPQNNWRELGLRFQIRSSGQAASLAVATRSGQEKA